MKINIVCGERTSAGRIIEAGIKTIQCVLVHGSVVVVSRNTRLRAAAAAQQHKQRGIATRYSKHTTDSVLKERREAEAFPRWVFCFGMLHSLAICGRSLFKRYLSLTRNVTACLGIAHKN